MQTFIVFVVYVAKPEIFRLFFFSHTTTNTQCYLAMHLHHQQATTPTSNTVLQYEHNKYTFSMCSIDETTTTTMKNYNNNGCNKERYLGVA